MGAALDGTVTRWSAGAEELFGWSAEEVVGRSISVLDPPGAASRETGSSAALLACRSDWPLAPFDTQRLTRQGLLVDVEAHVLPLSGEQGPVGLLAVFRDLSRARRAETSLTASEEELRARFAESPLAQSRVSLEGRVLAVNAAMEQLTGARAEDVVGRDVLGAYAPEERPVLEQALVRLASGVEHYLQRESTIVRTDGERRRIRMTVTAVRGAFGELHLAGSAEDVTALRLTEQVLREEAGRLEVVLSSMPVALFSFDASGRCTSSRGQALEPLGFAEGDLDGVLLTELYPEVPAVGQAVLRSLAGEDVSGVLDLSERAWECHLRELRDEDGAVVGGVGIAVDVTDLALAEREVRANETRLRALLSQSDDVVLVVEEAGRLLYVSPAVRRVLGYDDRALFWQPAIEGNHPDDRRTVAHAWYRVLRKDGASESFECRVRHADGSWRWCQHVMTNCLADPDVGGIVVNLRDVTDSRRVALELQRLALHDSLTGLANRALMLDRIEQALLWAQRSGTLTGLVVLDVVGMSGVNDRLGHEGGDAVLHELADRLGGVVRAADGVARIGGDTFAVLVDDVASTEELRALAAVLLEVADEPVDVQGQSVEVHLRAGSALGPAPSAGVLLAAAERALPDGEQSGGVSVRRAGVQAGPVSGDAVDDLREAIGSGQLRLHLQPIIRLEDGEVAGAEALVRWEHPRRGLLPPSEFVPLAEESGLVVELGAWVLRQACRRSASWQDAGRPLSVGANLSPRQLVGRAFPDLLRQVLAETGARAECIVLEVTESAMMDDPGAPEVLAELTDLGVRLALDDFGTGYSSLTYLRRFPVHAIKIDRSFVSGLGRNADDEAIVASVVSLARAVGKIVVAEGVETVGQFAALHALGVDQAQGFLWSPALPVEELEAWLDRRRRRGPEPPVPERRPGGSPGELRPPPDGDEERLMRLHEQGASLHTIAAALNAEGRRTPAGPRWTTTAVARVVAARR